MKFDPFDMQSDDYKPGKIYPKRPAKLYVSPFPEPDYQGKRGLFSIRLTELGLEWRKRNGAYCSFRWAFRCNKAA